jgi:hypothetical protein
MRPRCASVCTSGNKISVQGGATGTAEKPPPGPPDVREIRSRIYETKPTSIVFSVDDLNGGVKNLVRAAPLSRPQRTQADWPYGRVDLVLNPTGSLPRLRVVFSGEWYLFP